MSYRKVAQYRSVESLRQRWDELGFSLPIDSQILTGEQDSPLGQPLSLGSLQAGNRWCIHPMEGWDANRDGSPSAKTVRRWQRFGASGAKLIWGGEAAAVRQDGRANPNQTLATAANQSGLVQLREACFDAHRHRIGSTDDLIVGLQLTHSGRFCRPNDQHLEPRIAYHHPTLDAKYLLDPSDLSLVWTDQELDDLIQDFVNAARLAQEAGFHFVDIKACHGYLMHEFLSARRRPGAYGGDLAGRSRLLLETIRAVKQACPGLAIGVRLSVYDSIPFHEVDGRGEPMRIDESETYTDGFGVRADCPTEIDLAEPLQLIEWLTELDVVAINATCGSPYYNPHWQRPAIFPPSDGYPPPEDPLVGVARQITATRQIKVRFPDLPLVGTGYSYLQDYLPHVAQAVVREGWVDAVGLGRMVLSYPELPAESLRLGTLQRKLVCRTFSDCTTAPRKGLPSGCYPLDAYYKELPEHEQLKALKKADRPAGE